MIALMLWNLCVCVSAPNMTTADLVLPLTTSNAMHHPAAPVNPVFDIVMPSNSINTGLLVFSILMVLNL